ncbi:MAG: ribosome maturation factor RimM [Kineosporiaceae bacterium]
MRLVVARLGRAHGIRGELTVEVRTDAPEDRFLPGATFWAVPPAGRRRPSPVVAERRLELETVRDHNGVFLLKFEGVADRTAAEALRDLLLEAELPDVSDEDDAWYDHELTGLSVVDPEGAVLGEVVDVEHSPAQDLLVVRRPDGVRRYVPFVTAIVPTVDVAGGRLVLQDPGGLMHDPDEAGERES